jgi:hypothetical protein
MLAEILLVSIVTAFVASCFFYKTRRDRIEQTCIEESKAKTFLDEFVSNAIVTIVIGMIIYLVYTIFLAIDNGEIFGVLLSLDNTTMKG